MYKFITTELSDFNIIIPKGFKMFDDRRLLVENIEDQVINLDSFILLNLSMIDF